MTYTSENLMWNLRRWLWTSLDNSFSSHAFEIRGARHCFLTEVMTSTVTSIVPSGARRLVPLTIYLPDMLLIL